MHCPEHFSPEPDEMEAIVRGLYLSLLGREPDAPGLAHWVKSWTEGADLGAIAAGLLASAEYRDGPAGARRAAAAVARDAQRALAHLPSSLADSPIVIVDVGAQNLDNEDHVYAPLGRQGLPQRIIGFEPLEHRRRERQAVAGTGLTLLPYFIGDGHAHTFHINEPDATSSLLPFNRTVTDRLLELAPLRTVATEPAGTTTLDAALVHEPCIDLLKLDIQGFELAALQNARSVLQRTQVVHCEVSFVEIYRGQALFSEVEQHLRAAGFELVDLPTLCRYPIAGVHHAQSRDWLGWGDAVFFRQLPGSSSWRDQLVQSLIALSVYRKPSLAEWLARNLRGTPAAAYLAALEERSAA